MTGGTSGLNTGTGLCILKSSILKHFPSVLINWATAFTADLLGLCICGCHTLRCHVSVMWQRQRNTMKYVTRLHTMGCTTATQSCRLWSQSSFFFFLCAPTEKKSASFLVVMKTGSGSRLLQAARRRQRRNMQEVLRQIPRYTWRCTNRKLRKTNYWLAVKKKLIGPFSVWQALSKVDVWN